MDFMARCYQKNSSVISKLIGNEIVLVPIKGNTANLEEIFMLNETGGYIWNRIDGKSPVGAIKKVITEEFNVGPKEAQADITAFFKQLEKENCISVAGPKNKAGKNTKRSKRDEKK